MFLREKFFMSNVLHDELQEAFMERFETETDAAGK